MLKEHLDLYFFIVPLNIPVAFLLGWIMFRTWAKFKECAGMALKFSLVQYKYMDASTYYGAIFKKEYWLAWFTAFRFHIWVGVCIALCIAEHAFAVKLLFKH